MNRYIRIQRQQIVNVLKTTDKVVVIYGARQVGKTTLAKEILQDFSSTGYYNCEELNIREILTSFNSDYMYAFFSGHTLIVLDEAQAIPDIGRAIKILVDAHPELNIIATGSSSFELASKVNEPLTGRKYEFFLSGITFEEIVTKDGLLNATKTVNERIIYGNYPEVVIADSNANKRRILQSLATSYLYRDVLNYNNVHNPEMLGRILKALALQVGNEVSYNEIATLLQIDRKTVIHYIDLLEKAFVIYRIYPYFTNGRNELKKKPKVYFYDNGIINVLTGNFLDINSRNDVGGLWENYLMSQRRQWAETHHVFANSYFWRSHTGQEVDLVEEYDGQLHPYEFKYAKDKVSKGTRAFVKNYSSAQVQVINKDNFYEWLR
jgi:predicted AAA+ superfamily ATPase